MRLPTILKGEYDPDYNEQLNNDLNYGLLNGVLIEPLTDTQITSLASYLNDPILPEGFTMYDKTNIQLRIVTVPADPVTATNATLGTIPII